MILTTVPETSAEWTVVVVGDAVLALPDRAETAELAARLAGADGFRAALEGLVSRGIAAAPDFALVDVCGGVVRVVLRGPAEVESGAERVSGDGVATWTERVLEGVGELRLRVPGSTWAVSVTPVAGPAPAAEDAVPHATLAPPRDETVPDETMPGETAPDETVPEGGERYAFLFGDTVYRTADGADVRIPNPDAASPGDHDGRTVLVDELEPGLPVHGPAVRSTPAPSPVPALSAAPAPGAAYALVLPGGAVEPLTAPLLIGRSPSDPGRDASGGIPRPVTIGAGDKDISRTHVRVEVAGGAVVVTDLDSKNGTIVTLPGTAPRTLRAHEPAVVLPDTVIDLGGGVTMTVTETA